MPRPPILPLYAAWIKGCGEIGWEVGPKSGPLRPRLISWTIGSNVLGSWAEVRPVKTFITPFVFFICALGSWAEVRPVKTLDFI